MPYINLNSKANVCFDAGRRESTHSVIFFDDKLCENWKRYDRWYFRMTQLPNDTVTSPVLLSALSWTSIVLLHASSPKPVIFIPPIPIWIKGEDEVPIVISSFARQFLAQRCFEGHPPS